MVRSAFLATLVVGAIATVPAHSQAPPTPPDDYALTNVRIVVTPGRVIERGTVVLRDGRITAVGSQVAVPATAIRLDLPGHTVYPGLIDAAASFGLPSLNQGGGGPGGGGGGPPAPRPAGAPPAPAPEVMPAREAADVYAPNANELAAVRNAGITTLGLAFDGGLFPGRIAAVNTGGAARSPVLRPSVAQQVVFGRRRGGYPGTLMGAIAFVQQGFFDTQHEVRVRQAWERQPSGPRPDYRSELRGLEPAATGAIPVWFMAETERDIARTIDVANEIGVRNFTIVGAQEGWRNVADLKRVPQPVIVSLEWPAPAQITGRAFENLVAPGRGRNEAAERSDSAAARQARGNAAALAKAGVPFALSAYGLNSPAMLRERVRAAIEAGLSAEDALRALTVTPARLLGVDGVVGTIEVGKLANLVVTQGDLFARDTRIRHVFVEGVRHDVPAPTQQQRTQGAGQGRADAPAAQNSAVGDWLFEVDGPGGLIQVTLSITLRGDSLVGRMTSEMGPAELTGTQTGNEFTLSGTANPPGMNAMAITLAARVTGDEMRGTLTLQGMSPINFTGRRRTALPNWEGSR